MLKLSPCSCSHLHTGQLINISHLLSLHWLDYVGGGFLKFRKLGRRLILDRQELTCVRRSSSHQLRVVAAVWVIISVAHRGCKVAWTPSWFPLRNIGLCFVQTLVPHWSGCASGSEQCPSSLPFIPVTLSQDAASLSNDGAATLHFTTALPLEVCVFLKGARWTIHK